MKNKNNNALEELAILQLFAEDNLHCDIDDEKAYSEGFKTIRRELEQAQSLQEVIDSQKQTFDALMKKVLKMRDALFEINHNVVFDDDENTVIDYHETLEMHQRIAKKALEGDDE